MDSIEQSLRRALSGGDPHDPAFRESIYAASARAMERMIDTRQLDAAKADEERQRLYDAMHRVEAEYGAAPGHEPAAPETAPPTRAPESFDPGTAEPDAQTPAEAEWRPGSRQGDAPRKRSRRWLPLALTLLILGFVIWAAFVFLGRTESTTLPGGEDTASGVLDQPAPALEAPASAPSTPSSPPLGDLAWISVFSGTELGQLSAAGGGQIEAVDGEGTAAVRLTAPVEGEDEIRLAIGPGLVSNMAGHTVRIEMTMGSPDGQQRQFSVRCGFSGVELCQDQQFVTSVPQEAFVFDVAVPADAAAPAWLAVTPGLGDGPERDVDLYAVRLRIL